MPCSDSGAIWSASAAAATRSRIEPTWLAVSSLTCSAAPVTGSPGHRGGGDVLVHGHRGLSAFPGSLDRHEPVAHVPYRADQGLMLGAELGPQPPHVHVYRPGAAEVVVTPDFLQQVRP